MSSAEAFPDWSKGAKLPIDGRPNPYELPANEFTQSVRQGRLHALHYPVSVTGLILPLQPIDRFLRSDSNDPLRFLVQSLVTGVSQLHSLEDLQSWLGLIPYPNREDSGPFFIPFKDGKRPSQRMGFTIVNTLRGQGFTISCAQCHSENLFGRPVLGLSNRFPRANELFVHALKVVPRLSSGDFQWMTEATRGEALMYADSRKAAQQVGARKPVQLGLDTSLAQVALSLAKQTKTKPDFSAEKVSDSKPAVWWNLKYKNRWLSDGSIVSGNPILTNFLWNEIGRGTKLNQLSKWLRENEPTIRELTTAVFASQAPRWTDFFPPETVNEIQARRGETLFNQRCASCHGQYEKAWNLPYATNLTPSERLATVSVHYPQPTRVVNVGTDPMRFRGMRALLPLNQLEISRENGIVIERQWGYVPPPLEGIWARWPYFHNNSAPSLCAVLTRATLRPQQYWARPAVNPQTDFDARCNGYPSRTPPWGTPSEFKYNTELEGQRATGHDEGIFLKDGRELLSDADKMALIAFLQTL